MKRLKYGVGDNDSDYRIEIRKQIRLDNGRYKSELVWRCPFYVKWCSMLQRAYCKKFKLLYPSYEHVYVCEEWLTFSNFKSWMEQQDWVGKELDKDILFPGNKVYSPDKCVFIDSKINSFVVESNSTKNGLPIGVFIAKGHFRNKCYVAACSNPFTKKREHLGYYSTPEEAHTAWRKRKLELAIQLVDEEEDPRVRDALIRRYEEYDTKHTSVYMVERQ